MKEVGELVDPEDDYAEIKGDTPEEFVTKLFEVANRDSGTEGKGSFVYHIWFVKRADYMGVVRESSEFEFEELREYIRGMPTCLSLGEHINPNTFNLIDGYIFKEVL